MFPFHSLNPGAYVSDIAFWLRALEDYQKGVVSSHNHRPNHMHTLTNSSLHAHMLHCLLDQVEL
jgi:hypothetical protein